MHSPCTQITFIPSSYPNAPSTLLNIKHSTNQVFGEKLFHPSFFCLPAQSLSGLSLSSYRLNSIH